MAAFSGYLEQQIANWLKGTAFDAAPASLELALSTAAVLDDGSGLIEPVGGGYVRKPITFGALTTTNDIGTQFANDTDIVFTASGAAWGIISHWAIFSADGRFLLHGEFAVHKNIPDGDSQVVNAGAISFTIR